MSFKQCILNGIKEGLISEKQGETLYKNFDEIKDFYQYRKNLNKPEAEKKAAREVYDALKIEEAEKLRYTLQMRAKMNEIEFDWHSPGIRPQLFNKKTKQLEDDFVILKTDNTMHLLNSISPAWSSSFKTAKYIVQSIN